jgi:hypothetical protein
MPRAARPQPGYAPENKPRAASTSSASSIRTRQNVLDKPRYTITVYNLTFGDQSRNAEAARIYAGMTIRERRTTSNYSEIVAHELFHWFKQLPHMIFGATNARFCCVPSGLIGNAQWRTPETWSATDLTYLQAVVTTMFCPRRLAAARETEAVEIKLVPSNRRNLIVTIILVGECGLSLVYSER